MIPLNIAWYLLIPLNISWYLLISLNISWYLLIPLNIAWYLLIPLIIAWYLLIALNISWYLFLSFEISLYILKVLGIYWISHYLMEIFWRTFKTFWWFLQYRFKISSRYLISWKSLDYLLKISLESLNDFWISMDDFLNIPIRFLENLLKISKSLEIVRCPDCLIS